MQHPRNIVIVRHGETDRNGVLRDGRFLKDEDQRAKVKAVPDHRVELTDIGRQQATAIGRVIRDNWGFRSFDVYFDSGYTRSIQTLDLILAVLPPSESDPAKRRSHLDLRERDPGYTFLMTAQEAHSHFPWWKEHEELFGHVYSRPPGGESIAEAWGRVHMFLNSLRRSRPGEDVLIVTHGRVMLGFKYWMEKLPASGVDELYESHRKSIANGQTWWYRYDPRSRRYTLVSACDPLIPGAPPQEVN